LFGATRAAILLNKQLASEVMMADLASGGGQVMAGAGTGTAIRDLPRLVNWYGGTAKDWAKITGEIQRFGDGTTIEAHAYRNLTTGETVEIKFKLGKWDVPPTKENITPEDQIPESWKQ